VLTMNQVFQDKKQNQEFTEKGYLVIKGLLSEDEVGTLTELYKSNIPENAQGFHRSLDQLNKPYKEKLSGAIHDVVTPRLNQYLKDYRFLLVSFMIKEPGEDTKFEVHQNWNFVDETRFRSVAIWIPLVDVDGSNGTMHVAEGSHRVFPTIRGGPQIPSIFREIYDHIRDHYMKPILLKCGDALVIDDAILHYTSPNLGTSTRIAIAQVMIPAEASPIYYYQPLNNEQAPISKYLIDGNFYLYFNNRYTPDAPPQDCQLIQKFYTSLKPINCEEFDALMHGDSLMKLKMEEVPLGSQTEKVKSNGNNKPNFWQVYSPGNIGREILYRLGLYRKIIPDSARGELQKKTENEVSCKNSIATAHPQRVAHFYDQQHDAFMRVYGEVIQAFRTKNVTVLLDQQIQSIGLEPGNRVLDAGCGICAPAIHFAQSVDIKIEAITISQKQVLAGKKMVQKNQLEERINVTCLDYHQVSSHFPDNFFDKVYFLESFGHSHDKQTLLESVWKVLRPGGQVYIKDLFRKVAHHHELQERIDHEISRINQNYHYNVSDLNEFLNLTRKQGYILEYIKTIDLPLVQFEDLAISNEFQELTGIGRINDWKNYIFPIDFFEIRLMKPQFDLDKGQDRYFLQNLYRVQIKQWEETQL